MAIYGFQTTKKQCASGNWQLSELETCPCSLSAADVYFWSDPAMEIEMFSKRPSNANEPREDLKRPSKKDEDQKKLQSMLKSAELDQTPPSSDLRRTFRK